MQQAFNALFHSYSVKYSNIIKQKKAEREGNNLKEKRKKEKRKTVHQFHAFSLSTHRFRRK